MKPGKSNQKPKGKERTFETQTTTKITVTTGRLKKIPAQEPQFPIFLLFLQQE
jgi:hypothetical protein